MLRKFNRPTKLDRFPLGTVWKHEDELYSMFYIQTHEDEQAPIWELAGPVLALSFDDQFEDPKFIADILKLYKAKIKKRKALITLPDSTEN